MATHPTMDQLPIEEVLPELQEALANGRAALLTAQPGAGKTTRVPLALVNQPWLGGQKLVLLQPRRLAARAAASYMAATLQEPVGGTVGYRTRHDTMVGPSTRIEVVTEGILTRLLQQDPSLDGYGLIIFDEFHERSLHADTGLAFARETREKAMSLLAGQSGFSFTGGMNPISYLDFLKEVARSRICIDLPGLGPFCFRLVNYLAIGACVIAYPHAAILNSPLSDRKHIVYCKPDFSDLVDLCKYYLENDAEREQIAANAREFFDLNLHKDNLVRYYLHTCLRRLA